MLKRRTITTKPIRLDGSCKGRPGGIVTLSKNAHKSPLRRIVANVSRFERNDRNSSAYILTTLLLLLLLLFEIERQPNMFVGNTLFQMLENWL